LRSSPAILGIAAKRVSSNVEERLRERIGDDRLSGNVERKSRSGLRERFDDSNAEGPYIGGRGGRFGGRGGGFGRVVNVGLAHGFARLSDGKDGVGRKLELISNSEKIARLDVGVDIELGVEIAQHVDHGIEHVAGFFGSESALRKNLPEIFFGTFHNDVEQVHALEAAPAPVKKAQQIRMREFRDLVPDGKLLAGGRIVGRDKLNGGLAGLRIGKLREKDSAVIGGSEEMVKRELVVGELALPLFPNIAHGAPLSV